MNMYNLAHATLLSRRSILLALPLFLLLLLSLTAVAPVRAEDCTYRNSERISRRLVSSYEVPGNVDWTGNDGNRSLTWEYVPDSLGYHVAVSANLNLCDGAYTRLNGLNNTGYDYDVYCSTLLRFFAKYAPIGTKLTIYGKVRSWQRNANNKVRFSRWSDADTFTCTKNRWF